MASRKRVHKNDTNVDTEVPVAVQVNIQVSGMHRRADG
jgi:hypothetical protein